MNNFISDRKNGNLQYGLLLFVLLLLSPLAGWAQLDLGGCYYIKSNDNTEYYICPSPSSCGLEYATGQPYLTTYKTGDAIGSVWYFMSEMVDNVEYYYIVHLTEVKYMTFNEQMGSGGSSPYNFPEARLRIHLQTTPDGSQDQKSLFKLVYNSGSDYYTISPKSDLGNSLNPAGNNYNDYCGTDNKKIYLYSTGQSTNVGGLIGIYNNSDARSRWKLTATGPEQPTISYSHPNITFSHASSTSFKYTTDGRDPFLYGTTINSTSIDITEISGITFPCTIKAVALSAEGICSKVATYNLEQVETPALEVVSNRIYITCPTEGASIYYTTNGNPPDPTNSSQLYSNEPLTCSGTTIKAIAVKAGMMNSTLFSGSETLACDPPVITRIDATHFSITAGYPSPDVTVSLFYSIDGSDPTIPYPGTPVSYNGNVTVKAKATASGFDDSQVASMLPGGGTPDDPYIINDDISFSDFLSNANNPTSYYQLTANVNAPSSMNSIPTFSGTLKGVADAEGNFPVIYGLNKPLFTTATNATVCNIMLDGVNISQSDKVGSIAGTANGTTRIYNIGILGGSVGSTNDNAGGLVGTLDGTARVINCFSYATITGGAWVAGIVGYNNYSTTADDIKTMVMNCMFYGDITGGTTVSPVYGGNNINNLQGGLNTFNYYAYDKLKTKAISSGKYNCALAVEEKYLNRFEFYRLLLNSNKKLAAFYITGHADDADLLAKWVLETADRTITNPKPYPVLKAQGYYPSIINPDMENAPDSTAVGPNKGGKLGRTLTVTISNTKTDGGQSWPTGASITQTTTLPLVRTDKDFDRFNFNYDKVQLPYYNDVGSGNYTENRVVTGWKITAITPIPGDPYNTTHYPTTGITDYPYHNYADRRSSNKDLYTVSKRVFSQGAYFDVPYGVTEITIEPYWAKACYIADPNYDVVYDNTYENMQDVTQTGTQVNDPQGSNPTLFNEQSVETSITRILDYIANNLGGLGSTVYDNAIVLVGNLHLNTVPLNGNRPFTMMSVDTDNDHEPDYSLIYHHKSRQNITPIRFDFLAVPGTAQAQKPNGSSLICNFTIFKTRGWFEVTNTAFMYSSQVEYENGELGGSVTKIDAPLILLGGIFDQFVSTQKSAVNGKTIYIHVGSNVWINSFGLGTHSDGSKSTPHVPVSVTGGEFPGFYLTGTYNPNADERTDNAECYISGGYFHEAAGAAQEPINGNVRWQIYNADIDNFFGGGTNDAKPIKGDVTVDIYNSYVTLFCGGPKFGNMQTNKKVTTTAEGCHFGTYFGAGYGGISYSRKKYYDERTPEWGTTLQGYYTTDRGKYFDGATTELTQGSGSSLISYGYKGPGVATDFDYEFFVWSSGQTGGRFFVKFASFSLAQCNDVESTLTRCTINRDFFGGGNLGKVGGTTTSILNSCTVNGNVYGAGFSATLPTIEVRDEGFTKVPNYNSSSGMFEPGELSGTTTFEWQQVASYPEDGGEGFIGNYVITTLDLSKTNLGSVQEVSLTIGGNSTVLGDVFGGGDESVVGGNISVKLQGRTDVHGNVYGGGNIGAVGGNTSVTIESGSQPNPEPEPEQPTQD